MSPDTGNAAYLLPPRGYKYVALQHIHKELHDDVGEDRLGVILSGWFDQHLQAKGIHHHPDAPAWTLEWYEITEMEALLEASVVDEFSPGSEPEFVAGDWRVRGFTYVLEPDPPDFDEGGLI